MAIFRADVQSRTVDIGLQAFLLNIYRYMGLGLALTGVVAFGLSILPLGPGAVGMISLTSTLVALGINFYMGFGARRISAAKAQALFWSYAACMGGALTYIFQIYRGQTLASAFFVTAATFGAMTLYGHSTQRNLDSWGSFLRMGVFGIFFAMLGSVLMSAIFGARLEAFNFAVNVLTVLVFVGLIAYDTQKLRDVYYMLGQDAQAQDKMSVYGALTLYLNVVNIFLALLRLMGGNDRR